MTGRHIACMCFDPATAARYSMGIKDGQIA